MRITKVGSVPVSAKKADDLFWFNESLKASESPKSTKKITDSEIKSTVFTKALKEIEEKLRKSEELEEKLRYSRNQLKAIMKAVAEGIYVEDSKEKMVYGNDALAVKLGYKSPDDLISEETPWTDKFEIWDEKGKALPLRRLPGKRAHEGEVDAAEILKLRNKETGEEFWASLKARPIYDRYGNVELVINVLHDLTELKEHERTRDEFMAIASHELKNPITGIKFFSQLIEKKLKKIKDKDALIYIAKLEYQADKMTDLINQLLNANRIQQGRLQYKMAKFDFDKFVLETAESLKGSAKGRIVIKGLSKKKITGDKERLSQVVINLINNALKYSPERKKVIVSVYGAKDKVGLTVRDFGSGISKELREKVFERYYRIEDAKGKPGLGIGLYISREIVKRHRGKIWVEPGKNGGAVFFLNLPITNK